ncbi:DUF5783 family protein [Halapricum salinum]|uniref:Uncharacterized protein n=1 Tax=Halapricum salinum TaxID=1457250 RepID=A0A4D6HFN5_9EURY|nr:DUF5783 family protein [Halapricum salinum]QCC52600.1 hypothetical protein DV733_15790 [Halapricum salinum]
MTSFDPEKFEDKYEHYFTELQQAYKQAFDAMSDRHSSDLVHGVDQRVLAESEPFYEGDGQFRVELPEDAVARLTGEFPLSDAELQEVYDEYTDEIERQLRSVFDLE